MFNLIFHPHKLAQLPWIWYHGLYSFISSTGNVSEKLYIFQWCASVHVSCLVYVLCSRLFFLLTYRHRHIKLCWSSPHPRFSSSPSVNEFTGVYMQDQSVVLRWTVQGFVIWTSLVPLPLVVVVMMYCVVACWLAGCCSRCSVWVWVVVWGTGFVSCSVWPSEIT